MASIAPRFPFWGELQSLEVKNKKQSTFLTCLIHSDNPGPTFPHDRHVLEHDNCPVLGACDLLLSTVSTTPYCLPLASISPWSPAWFLGAREFTGPVVATHWEGPLRLEWQLRGDKGFQEPRVLSSPHPQVPTTLDPRRWVLEGRIAHASLRPTQVLLGFLW